MNFNIRKGTIEDTNLLSRLSSKTFYDTFVDTCTKEDMDGFIEECFSEKGAFSDLANDSLSVYFYEIDNKAIGFAKIHESYTGFKELKNYKALEIRSFYFLKEYHGVGVAKNLMNFIVEYSLQNSFTLIWLGVWEHNERAKAFYQKNGFSDTGHSHPFPIGNTPQTDLWYWRKL